MRERAEAAQGEGLKLVRGPLQREATMKLEVRVRSRLGWRELVLPLGVALQIELLELVLPLVAAQRMQLLELMLAASMYSPPEGSGLTATGHPRCDRQCH